MRGGVYFAAAAAAKLFSGCCSSGAPLHVGDGAAVVKEGTRKALRRGDGGGRTEQTIENNGDETVLTKLVLAGNRQITTYLLLLSTD